MDCFYCQVEELRDPRLSERPTAVTQKYLIVTANYRARAAGLGKLMSIDEAKRRCPEVVLISGQGWALFTTTLFCRQDTS